MNYTLSYTPSGDKVSFATIENRLEETDIRALAKIGEMDRIQARFVPCKENLDALNKFYYEHYPKTGFRLYSLPSDHEDLSGLSALTHLQKLALETYKDVSGIEVLSRLPYLKKLLFDVYLRRDCSFLNLLPIGLEQLSLETKSAALDLSHLLRFQSLKVLHLRQYKKNIDSLSGLPLLEGLTLRGITPENFVFVNAIQRLRRFRIQLGAARDFSALHGNTSIIALQMFRISNLDNAELAAKLPNLEAIELSQLSHIHRLPDLSNHDRLEHVLLDDMKGLTDLSALEHVPNLKSVSFSVCPRAFEPKDIVPVLRNPSVESCSFYTASEKRNRAIGDLIAEYGKKDKNNFITVRKILFDDFSEL